MSWSELIKREIAATYGSAEGLVNMVDDSELSWKPATGKNWMTVGQLLMHITNACGAAYRGFVTGDWRMPEGVDLSEMKPEEMLPPAEKLPAVGSVAQAKKLFAEDKQVALEMLAKCDEKQLDTQEAPAPWDPSPMILGHRMLQSIHHLDSHKHQLFCYLKLQGKPVNTGHLWGM
jgi:hypothetical protein